MLSQMAAQARLTPLVAINSCPKLTSDDLANALEVTRRASIWAASTAVAFGDRYVPLTQNGRLYTVLTAGTTGASEPAWPLSSYLYRQFEGQRVHDGTVVWIDAGPAHREVYDVRAAAKYCWLQKAGVASDETDFKAAGGDSFSREAIYQHCVAQAGKFGRVSIG